MKKTLFIILALLVSTMNFNLFATETHSETIQFWVQAELDASIKADCHMAQRMITLDIEDDLDNLPGFTDMNTNHSVLSQSGMENLIDLTVPVYSAQMVFSNNAE